MRIENCIKGEDNAIAAVAECSVIHLFRFIPAGPGPASAHGFEVVPQANSASGSDSESDSEDEFDALDANGKAEVRTNLFLFLVNESMDTGTSKNA